MEIFPTVNVRMKINKLKNIEKDRMLPNPTIEETAEEASQRVNAKRLAAKERKIAQLDEDQPGQRESKCIKTMMIGFGILTWIRSSMPTRF